jgi:hypothetical protein
MSAHTSLIIAAFAYACFILTLAHWVTPRKNSVAHGQAPCKPGFLYSAWIAVFPAVCSFFFMPVGLLPPLCTSGAAVGIIFGCHAAVLFLLGRAFPSMRQTLKATVICGLLPLAMASALFAQIGYTLGFPGEMFDLSTFVSLPLWAVMEWPGSIGLAAIAVSIMLLGGGALLPVSPSPLAWAVLRLSVAHFCVQLLLPLSVFHGFLPENPEHALYAAFIGNWCLVVFIVQKVFPLNFFWAKRTAVAWALFVGGALLCLADIHWR